MTESVSFNIKVNDLGSSSLAKFASNANKHVKRVQRITGSLDKTLVGTAQRVDKVSRAFHKINSSSSGVKGLTKSLKTAEGQFDRLINKANRFNRVNNRATTPTRGMRGGGFASGMLGGGMVGMASMYLGPIAIGAGFAKAVQTGAELESKLVDIKGIMSGSEGFTNQAFDKMIVNMKQLGADTIFTSSQVLGATKYMAMAGLGIEEINSSMKSVTSLAAISNSSLETTADIITNIQTSYGIAAENMGNVADVMTKVQTTTNTNVLELGEAFSYAGNIAAQSGLDFKEVASFLGVMANNGIKASRAGTNLRRMMLKMQAPTEAAKKVMSNLGLSFTTVNENGKTVLKPLSQMIKEVKASGANAEDIDTLFGVYGGSAYRAVANSMKDGELLLDAIKRGTDKAGGIADALAEQKMKTFYGTVAKLTAQFELFSANLFDKVSPGISKVLNGLAGIFININQEGSPAMRFIGDSFNLFVNTLKVTYQTLSAIFGFISSNWGWISGLALVIGGWTVGIRAYNAAMVLFNAITTAGTLKQFLFNAAMWANPAGLVVGAIFALGAGVIWCWNHFESFRGVIMGVWEVMKSFAGGIGDLFTSPFDTIKSVFTKITDFVVKQIQPLFEMIDALKNGEWAKAALAGGKLLLNLSPIGIAKGIAGGETFKKGFQKGKDSEFRFGLPSFMTNGFSLPGIPDLGKMGATGSVASTIPADLGGSSVGGGIGDDVSNAGAQSFKGQSTGGGAGLTVIVESFMKGVTINASSPQEIKNFERQLSDVFMNIIKDFETSY